jgi:hypothetical protein
VVDGRITTPECNAHDAIPHDVDVALQAVDVKLVVSELMVGRDAPADNGRVGFSDGECFGSESVNYLFSEQ